MSDTQLAQSVENNPALAITDHDVYRALRAQIGAEVEAFAKTEPDVTTDKGRKAIKSLAFKITRTKTAIDKAGNDMNKEARARIAEVNHVRNTITDDLATLAAEVRKPLTQWERAEAQRKFEVEDYFNCLERLRTLPAGINSDAIQLRLTEVAEMFAEVHEDKFLDETKRARELAEVCEVQLRAAMETAQKAEADAAELAALRAEKVARDLAEAAERDQAALEVAASEPPPPEAPAPRPAPAPAPAPRPSLSREEEFEIAGLLTSWLQGLGVPTAVAQDVADEIVAGKAPHLRVV